LLLLASSALGETPGPEVQIHSDGPRHTISPYIYGINFGLSDEASEAYAAEIKLPVNRWGGNSTTSYNWRDNVTNTAADWFFENFPGSGTPGEALPNGSAFDQFVSKNQSIGCQTLGTIPIIGWTPRLIKDCSYSVKRYGSQEKVDQWWTDCGNGMKPDGKTKIINDPHDAYQETTPQFMAEWIQHLVGHYGPAQDGGVRFYNLDNEPDWWFSTHRDIHFDPATYDNVRDQTLLYAPAIKAADPGALLIGPTVGGWWSALYSAADWVAGWGTAPWFWDSNPVDRRAHGDIPFIEWYLQQMKEYEKQHGVRILDYVDVHAYISPDLNSDTYKNLSAAEKRALRLDSTRALWDPDYQIPGSDIKDKPRFIRRMHEWVDRNYPGTKLATTEYNWGALDSLEGALAQADILGIFGREQMDLATLWGPPKPDDPGAYAWRLYRNYDGLGGMFGDMAIPSTSTDQGKLAVYAARRGRDNALTMIFINKTADDLTSPVQIVGASLPSKAQVYRYSAANLKAILQEDDQALTPLGFTATFPAYSMTMVVAAVEASADRKNVAGTWANRARRASANQQQRNRARQ
jgi:hypothetical protein